MVSPCNHFRIRDDKEYGFDVEHYIKSVEKQFEMDIRKHPQWKEILQRLHVATTDCKRKKLASDFRKKYIIDNLYVQATRLSPFQLNDMLARTSKKWKAIEDKIRNPKVTSSPTAEEQREYSEVPGEMEQMSTAHPNTEVVTTLSAVDTDTGEEPIIEPKVQTDFEVQSNVEELHRLPIFLRVNQHTFLSPLGTKDSGLSYVSKIDDIEIKTESDLKEWSSLKQSKMVKCIPDQITIIHNILDEQRLKFSIINCTTEYLQIVFKYVTDKVRFKWARVVPDTPLRLYPGIRISFKFIFKLFSNENAEDFVSNLLFKVGSNTRAGLPAEAYLVPIVTKLLSDRCFTVSETVVFTPVYSWHINGSCGYPTGVVKVSVSDGKHYNIRVTKRVANYTVESTTTISDVVIAPDTVSLMEREDSQEPGFLSPEFSAVGEPSAELMESESVQVLNFIGIIVNETVDRALEAFIIEHTFIDLRSHSKKVLVYFTKAEHIGYHQSFYDFHLYDSETGDILQTKSVLLLAEVLPHPIVLNPELLDMSDSPISHGFCEDRIIITNNHKVFNVIVKFKLTTKMRKLFRIFPMETLIEPKSNTAFIVRTCSKEFKSSKKPEDFAHFTIKIIFSGHKAVYDNIPRLFYEIIAPCAVEFKNTYNEKYYKEEISRRNSAALNDNLPAIDVHLPVVAENYPATGGKSPSVSAKSTAASKKSTAASGKLPTISENKKKPFFTLRRWNSQKKISEDVLSVGTPPPPASPRGPEQFFRSHATVAMKATNSNSESKPRKVSAGGIKELVQCALCLEVLHSPRMLPCQHTFCAACLAVYVADQPIIDCPTCQTRIQVHGPKFVEGLPSNMYIDSLLQLVGAPSAAESPPESPGAGAGARSVALHAAGARCSHCKTTCDNSDINACEHCKLKFCKVCWAQHLDDMRIQIASIVQQLDSAANRLQHKIEHYKDRCDRISEQINLAAEERIAAVAAAREQALAQAAALGGAGALAARALRRSLQEARAAAERAATADLLPDTQRVTTFMNLHQNAIQLLSDVSKWDSERFVFDKEKFRVETESEAPLDAESDEPEPAVGHPDPLASEESLLLYYRSRHFVPHYTWRKTSRPCGVGLSPWDNHLYICAMDSHSVIVVERTHAKIVNRFSCEEMLCPAQVAFMKSLGEVYVTDKWKHCVHVFSKEGVHRRSLGGKGSRAGLLRSPEGLAADDSARLLYVVDTGNDRVQILQPDGTFVGAVGVSVRAQPAPGAASVWASAAVPCTELNAPTAVALAGDRVVVLDAGNRRVKVYNKHDKGKILEFGSLGQRRGQFRQPEVLAVDPMGNILVGDSGNCRVQVFRPDGQLVRVFGGRGGAPGRFGWISGIHVTDQLDIIVSDSRTHYVNFF